MEIIPTIRAQRRETAPDFYLAYLNSSAWRMRRNRALKLGGYRCFQCGSKRDLQVHHLSYERLGAEHDSDLQVLCADCHEGHHIEKIAKSEAGIYLKLASQALRESAFSSIADLADDTKRLCAKHHIPYDGPEVNRALGLISGTRIRRVQIHVPHWVERKPDPAITSAQEVHEWISRSELGALVNGLIKSMPPIEPTPSEQLAHEVKIREQANALRWIGPKRARKRPVMEVLEEIFS